MSRKRSGLPEDQEEQAKEFYGVYFDHGRWFRFPKALLKIKVPPRKREREAKGAPRHRHKTLIQLEWGPLILLAFLISYHFRVEGITAEKLEEGQVVEDHNGFFYCKGRTITKELGLTKDAQCATLARLVECGLIMLSKKGMPPLRFIKINFQAIIDAINAD